MVLFNEARKSNWNFIVSVNFFLHMFKKCLSIFLLQNTLLLAQIPTGWMYSYAFYIWLVRKFRGRFLEPKYEKPFEVQGWRKTFLAINIFRIDLDNGTTFGTCSILLNTLHWRRFRVGHPLSLLTSTPLQKYENKRNFLI